MTAAAERGLDVTAQERRAAAVVVARQPARVASLRPHEGRPRHLRAGHPRRDLRSAVRPALTDGARRARRSAAPSSGSILGTDYVGEDVLSRVLSGGRYVLWMATAAGLIGTLGGTLLGVTAGYGRRWVDEAIMRSLDVLLAVPTLVFTLLFISMLGSSPVLIVILVGIAWMPTVARTIRAATLEIGRREFIEAAEVIGTPRRKILLNDILPNLMTIILVELGLRCAWSISLVSAISFLGFGISPPHSDWGLMINENSVGLSIQPWGVVAPIICIGLFSIGVSLLSDGLSRAVSGSRPADRLMARHRGQGPVGRGGGASGAADR